ncbi:MAG: OmpA family protein [Oleiphilaceae bacterium]|nr:OmpA family protein [Oleiphilaceae bacterium]
MAALPQKKKKQESSGGWIVTFADLMSLLLTFFILLLSFSKMDLHKYEMMAQSMAESFGVSFLDGSGKAGGEIIFAEEPPISPPVEELNQIEQEFEEFEEESGTEELEMLDRSEGDSEVVSIDPNIEQLTETLVEELETEIVSNALNVSFDSEKVVVRFSEEATFTSGSEEIKDDMFPILEKIENVLASCQGQILVSGYTDDLPVTSNRFRSNWDLSAGRAVSVVHQLIFNNKIDANRVIAAGRAETNPLVPNDSPENRAKNRRVEISIYDPECQSLGIDF